MTRPADISQPFNYDLSLLFPALFLVILGPAFIRILEGFKGMGGG